MFKIEDTALTRPGEGIHMAAGADRRPARILLTGVWRRILITVCLAVMGCGLAGQATHTTALAAGNEDAAHACQQGGYLNLAGVGSNGQIITFKNAGECVSYAAHGGVFTTPILACAVTATSGCLTLNGDTFQSIAGTGNSITLTGATSFDDGFCNNNCPQVFPNPHAMGAGLYVETNSSGGVISQGTFRIADTTGSFEGLYTEGFFDASDNLTTCTAASLRVVAISATLIDATTSATQTVLVEAITSQTVPTNSQGVVFAGADFLVGPIPSTAITC